MLIDVSSAYESEDSQHLSPVTLWQLLKTYVHRQGVPLILDIEAGPEVWNYPVYSYEINYKARGNAGRQIAQLTLLMAGNGVDPDYCGVKVKKQTYRFSFLMRDGTVVTNWSLWLPAVAAA